MRSVKYAAEKLWIISPQTPAAWPLPSPFPWAGIRLSRSLPRPIISSAERPLTKPWSIIKVSDYDKPANLKVTITKTGNKQLLAGDSMRYDLTVSNTSNVALDNFFWHDRFPTDCATAKSITTGTYNTRLNYRITYKTTIACWRPIF